MAWPKEKEHTEYLKYLERHDLGEEEGPRMSKEDWRKMRKQMEESDMDESSHQSMRASRILSGIGEELRDNPPEILAKTRKKKGAAAAESQRKAILLSKAREAGADIPR